MTIRRKPLSRRTLLRGAGVAIGLPFLDAMAPASTSRGQERPVRMCVVYIPNGVTFPEWLPKTTGADYELTRILKPLERHRKDFSVLSGLDHHQANALGDGGGDHARAGAVFLTGVHPHKTSGADIRGGVSIDQIVAQEIGDKTRLASLELGCEDSRTVGNCDTGYSCAYTNSIAWRSPTLPMPPETNPRIVFERLFGAEDRNLSEEERARRAAMRKSILDVVGERTKALLGELGPADRRKVDEQMTAIREIEKRIEVAERDNREFDPGIEKPAGIPVRFDDYAKLMFDLQIQAFQADLTRVTTFMIGREGSVRTYAEIGVTDPHHPITHHRDLPDLNERVTKINVYHAELFAYFLDRMKAAEDGDSNLLDRSMIVYGSAIADGDSHKHEDVPVLLAGRGDGRLKPGSHIRYDAGTPVMNLFGTLAEQMQVRPESLGDSTGKLAL